MFKASKKKAELVKTRRGPPHATFSQEKELPVANNTGRIIIINKNLTHHLAKADC